MALQINILKLFLFYLKERLKHPFSFKRKRYSFYSEPALNLGLSDHPLDYFADPPFDVFTFFKKLLNKKAYSIKEVELKEQRGNNFIFSCKAYNIYIRKEIPEDFLEEYEVPKLGSKPTILTLEIDFIQDGIYRVRCIKGDVIPEHSTPMIYQDITDLNLKTELEDKEEYYLIKTELLSLKIFKAFFRIEILDITGNIITESSGSSKNEFIGTVDSYPLGFVYFKKKKRMYGIETFVTYPGEAIYGFGERFGPLNKMGQTFTLWHADGMGNSSGRTYKNIPFFMSTRGYGVYINESKPITFWVGTRETCKIMMGIEGSLIDYFFFYGPSLKTILGKYTDLTGKAEVPPKWSFGMWMSRISYRKQDEVLEIAKKLREMKYPCDVIHIDTGWFKGDWECDWNFDNERFPDPKAMMDNLKEMGFKTSLWQTPYIFKSPKYQYKEAKKLGILAKNHGAFSFLLQPAAVLDFSNPDLIKWYQNKLKNLFELGAAVIKTDFGEIIEPHQEFSKYNGREMHNLFPLLYQKAAFEATKEFYGKGIIWARSGYAGSQRYPVHWSGDSSSAIEGMLSILRGGLSLGLSGFSYWSQDVGGFIISPTDEAYIRWTQFSIFNSHIRFHGNPPRYREPWNYSKEAQKITRDMLNLRYQLLPYIYTEAHYISEHGFPMLYPLILEFDKDPTTYNIEDEFLFGRNLLIAPILTKKSSRKIYIPAGEWYDYWSLERYCGPKWIDYVCDISKVPFFIKGGTILPLGPVIQYVEEKPLDTLTLYITPRNETDKIEYTIIDDEEIINIKAELKDKSIKIEISKKVSKILVFIPTILEITSILINDKNVTIQEKNENYIKAELKL